jgi:hypothetical protein
MSVDGNLGLAHDPTMSRVAGTDGRGDDVVPVDAIGRHALDRVIDVRVGAPRLRLRERFVRKGGRSRAEAQVNGMMPAVNRVPVWFAERTARGMLTRMVGPWLLVGLPVIAARIWWSVPAAIAVFVVTLTAYVTVAIRYMRRHRQPA